jgi:phi13 family phage major tail protein
MGNNVTYGLDKVHIAFKGISQTETIEVLAGATADGELTVTITATALLSGSSPRAVVVPVSSETHTTIAKVASAIVNALNNDDVISGVFTASHSAGVITLKTKVAQTNDSTLLIAVTPASTAVTVGASTSGTSGTASWGMPVAIPGAVRFAPSVKGDENIFYADDGPYFSYTPNNGYTAELEMALVPDEVLVEMLGWRVDSNGMVVELADGKAKRFALMGQVLGDDKNRRFVYYDCQASRPAKEQSTLEDNVEPVTDVLNLTIFPIEIGSEKVVRGTMELSSTNAAAYNAFFDAVVLPQTA